MWIARAEYADGTEIEKDFPYFEDGDWERECKRQQQLEEWLINQKDGCIWFSVSCEEWGGDE